MRSALRQMQALAVLMSCIACGAVPSSAFAQRDDDFAGIAATYLKARNSQLVSGATTARALPRSAVTRSLAAREEVVKTGLRDRREQLAESGERYTRFQTNTRVLKITRSPKETIVRVKETTRLPYDNVTAGAPAFTAFTVERDFAFERTEGGWVIKDVRLVQRDGVLPLNEVAGAVVERANVQPLRPDASSGTSRPQKMRQKVRKRGLVQATAAAGSYNYAAMVAYAQRYALQYNGAYRRMGNDCTNFVSQAMRAGGWSMVSGWYRSSGVWWYNFLNQSWTWGGAQNWYWFARDKGRVSRLSNVWYMGLADVLQIDFDRDSNLNHTMIVTGVDARGERYLTYHTNDTLNRSLSSILAAYPAAWYYARRT